MKKIAGLFLGLAASVMAAQGANAADLPMTPTVVATTPAPPPPPAFNWNRFYFGAYGGLWQGPDPRFGAFAGRNILLGDRFVVGADIAVGFWGAAPMIAEWTALGRLGVVLGDSVLVYGGAGANANFGAPPTLTLATGVEIALGANASLRGEVLFWDPFGGIGYGASLGLAWHLGN